MKHSNFSTPDLQAWQNLSTIFRSRLKGSPSNNPLDLCIDQKFMLVQFLQSDLPSGTRYQSRSAQQLLHDLADDFGELLSNVGLQLTFSCFGQANHRNFYECDYLGIWCLMMELVTRAERGSTIELTMGTLPHGTELEIGCDSQALEQSGLLDSQAWDFTRRLISIDRALDLKCPVGGIAIQLDFSNPSQTRRRVA